MTGCVLLVVYAATAAPGVTFWDAGEFIAAAHVFGIPHPPGTPLFVALDRVWTLAFGGMLGVARASNLLSATCTAVACALLAWVVSPRRAAGPEEWGALSGGLCAGLMASVWANATETEVYAVSLLHVAAMLCTARRAADADDDRHRNRWLLLTGYLIALAPAVHLSALVGAPAAIGLASREVGGRWRVGSLVTLSGVLLVSAGLGRMSPLIVAVGLLVTCVGALAWPAESRPRASKAPTVALLALLAIAASAVLILLVRARLDPLLNQGNPSTLTRLADVIARRQYDVAPMWPRRAPAWIQLATLVQYADWQVALAWGNGIFTTPLRVVTTLVALAFGVAGWRAIRRDAPRAAEALGVLLVCGSLGVCVYLNLKAGATIGYGFVPADAHEARERDYFFVLAFWAWGMLIGYGAVSLLRARGWPPWVALAAVIVPLAGNWPAEDRSRGAEATAPRDVAKALLEGSPRNAVLFVAGDNDTYPLWYLQDVEGVRRDVTVVTFPLLPADWYAEEIARRTGLRWPASAHVDGARWQHEERAALIARAARAAGRPVAASAALTARERALLGSNWLLRWAAYVSSAPSGGSQVVTIDGASAPPGWTPGASVTGGHPHLPDDVTAMMRALLDCPALAALPRGQSPSLESTCNVR